MPKQTTKRATEAEAIKADQSEADRKAAEKAEADRKAAAEKAEADRKAAEVAKRKAVFDDLCTDEKGGNIVRKWADVKVRRSIDTMTIGEAAEALRSHTLATVKAHIDAFCDRLAEADQYHNHNFPHPFTSDTIQTKDLLRHLLGASRTDADIRKAMKARAKDNKL